MVGKYIITLFNHQTTFVKNSLVLIFLLGSTASIAQTTIATGFNSPFEITIKDETAFVGEFSSARISSLDLTVTNPTAETVLNGIPQPTIIVFNESDVYIGQANGVITKRLAANFSMDIETLFVNTSPVVGIAIDGTDLYFSEFVDNGRIQRIDLTDIQAGAETIATGFSFGEQIELIGNELFIASAASGLLEKIDISINNPPIETVLSGLNSPSGLHQIGTLLYITESVVGGRILRIDTAEDTPSITTITSGLDTPFGIDELDGILYVVLRGNDSVVSVEDLLATDDFKIESEITLFPNPSAGRFTISNPKNKLIDAIAVYNAQGQRILEQAIGNTEKSLDLKLLASTGLYVVVIQSDNQSLSIPLLIAE